MGYTPREVYDMSVPEFWACVAGWQRAHGAKQEAPPMTREEMDQIVAELGL